MYSFYTKKLWQPHGSIAKLFLIMRLTTIILVSAILQVSASSFGQKVTLRENNVRIVDVFNKIRLQTGHDFLISASNLKLAGSVSITVKDTDLKDVLNYILKGKPLTYQISGASVIITAKEKSFLDRTLEALTRIDVRGHVLNEKNEPLAGASVLVKGTNKVVQTDKNGTFSISGLSDDAVLTVSYIGYRNIDISINKDLSAIRLFPEENKLQEVVINKGYYTTTEKLNTGSTVQINSAQLARQPISNPIQALQGLVPGMYIKQNSGMAGASTTVQIRGRNSINSGLIPLYILDGVPFNGVPVDQQVGASATILGAQPNGSTDPLSNISPADIESITILKDADATAIYGSRGANGVVLITTKRGRKGRSTLDVNYTTGLAQVVNQRDLLSSEEYLALRKQAFTNDNRTLTVALAPDLLLWDQNANTDYQDLLIGNTAKQHDLNASLSMGSDKSSLYVSTNYRQESTVLYGGRDYKKGGVNFRGTQTSADNRLKVDLGATLNLSTNDMLGSDFGGAAMSIPANYPLYDANGKLYWISNFTNPIATSNQKVLNKSSNINLNGTISYQITDELSFRTGLGYTTISQTINALAPASTLSPLSTTPISSGIYSQNEGKVFIAEPQLDYKRTIWKGKLSATLGGAWQQSKNNQPYFINANTFASESLMDSYTNAANFTIVRSLNSEYRYISGFGRLNYTLMDRYIVNAVLRRDGSSRFGPGKKYGNFGSVGLGWVFSDENFMKNQHIISFGKLRTSYGVTGNDQFDNYSYMDTYTTTTSSYGGNPGFYPTRVANEDFNWENNRKFEVAAELGLFNDMFHLTAAFYRNRSGNMVVRNAPLPAQTGFISYITNLDALVQNSGFEFDLQSTIIKTKDLNWTASFNISTNTNKLMSLPKALASLYNNSYQVGQSLNSFIVYEFTGFVDGVAQFKDRDGDGAVSTGLTKDTYVAANRDPKYFGGFSSALSYKGFRLDFLINFIKQKGSRQIGFPGLFGNQFAELSDTEFKPSSLTSSASYASYVTYGGSDALIVDASFARLRNLSLAYSIPQLWTSKLGMKQAQIFARGQNLLTVTSYKGLDPETQGSTLPPLKMYTIGVQCSF
jgi:TonB-linked SusC/RagA family outer membrane protein